MDTMTDAQWDLYVKGLAGMSVDGWTGWVEDVRSKTFGGYELWIDMDSPDELISVQDVSFDIPDSLALELNKDDKVNFSGTIYYAQYILGSLQISLENPTVEPAP